MCSCAPFEHIGGKSPLENPWLMSVFHLMFFCHVVYDLSIIFDSFVRGCCGHHVMKMDEHFFYLKIIETTPMLQINQSIVDIAFQPTTRNFQISGIKLGTFGRPLVGVIKDSFSQRKVNHAFWSAIVCLS